MSRIPFFIGVAGGTASGKTSVCTKIMNELGKDAKRVVMIQQDSFYSDLRDENDKEKARKGEYNFDHPDAFDHNLLISVLRKLQSGQSTELPKYDFITNSRVLDDYQKINCADVVVVEGILIFYDSELRSLFDMKLFVDADPDIRLARRVDRDIKERGRSLQQVLQQYLTLVKPAFEEFCLPTKKYADIIIPRGIENDVAIELIVKHIQEILRSPKESPDKQAADKLPSPKYLYGDGKIQQKFRPH